MHPPYTPPTTPLRARHFSLVELVLVTSILLLLMAMVMPSMKGLMRANGVNIGSSIVAQEMRLARQRAVANGRHVAVLLPTAENDDEGGFSDPDYKASAIRSCFLDGEPQVKSEDIDGTTYTWYEGTWDGYVQNSQWEFLPAGVYLGYSESFGPYFGLERAITLSPTASGEAATPQSLDIGPRACNVVSGINFPSATSVTQVDNLRAIIFRPNGTVVPAPNHDQPNHVVVIQNGQIRDAGSLIFSGDVSNNLVGFYLNRFTGHLQFY